MVAGGYVVVRKIIEHEGMGDHPTAMFQASDKCCARKLSSAIHPLFSESTDQHMPWQFRYIHAMHLRRLAGSSSALGMPKPSRNIDQRRRSDG